MLICQPPLKHMFYRLSCCEDDILPAEADRQVVYSSTGLTVGDLLRHAARLQDTHKLCKYEEASNLDVDGFVRPIVTFEGLLTLRADDPLISRRRRRWQEGQESESDDSGEEEDNEDAHDKQQRHQERMEDYTDAKWDGKSRTQFV